MELITRKTLQRRVGVLICVFVFVFLNACSSATKSPEPPKSGHGEDGVERIALFAINDFHGNLAPVPKKTRETGTVAPISYESGGAVFLASHLKLQRERHGNRLLILDAGDEFQGTIESNSEEGKPVVDFYNAIGVQAAAIGNHEFDYGPEGPNDKTGDPQGALRARLKQAQYPYLAANILDRKTGERPTWDNLVPSKILNAGPVRVGVIGLSTLQTPVTTRAMFVDNLRFTELKAATLREAKSLREQGAQIIVIVAHVGLRCRLDPALFTTKEIPIHHYRENPDDCDDREEMVELVKSLPTGTVDAVVSGHSHTVVHHWIHGVPVIQAGAYNRYYNVLHLAYDTKTQKILKDQTQIEGPIPVCPQVFKNQNNCEGDIPAPREGRGSLVTPRLYGKKLEADPVVSEILKPVFERTKHVKSEVIGTAAQPIDHYRPKESPLGNLVTDALRDAGHADVAIANPGGIRTNIEVGPITYEGLFRVLPFDNAVSILKVTGRELKLLLRVAESGARGFFPISGVQMHVLDPTIEAKTSDLNGNRKIEAWEADRLLDVRMSDGKRIQDDKLYTVATIDFLVTGGDDMGWVMNQIPKERVTLDGGDTVRDVVRRYIEKLKVVNTAEHPLIDPNIPRIVVEKSWGKKKAKGSRKSKSRKKKSA